MSIKSDYQEYLKKKKPRITVSARFFTRVFTNIVLNIFLHLLQKEKIHS